MIYNYENARGSKCYDSDTGQEIGQVLSVDTDAGIVTRAYSPSRVNRDAQALDTFEERFSWIEVGTEADPFKTRLRFDCYGRKTAAQDAAKGMAALMGG